MKKFSLFLGLMLILASFLMPTPKAVAITEPVVDKEFTPGFNYYGRDNSVFLSACTRFTPARSSHTNYFDLAVKNDQGAGYPIKASIRAGWSSEAPNETSLKAYTQSTFNNYAMGQGFSRFVSNDSETISLTVGTYYWICIDDLANNNATGWFYTASVADGYSRMGYPGDVQTPFNGSFGYRTFAYEPSTPADDLSGGTTPSGTTTGTTGANTTGNSKIANGAAPSSKISSSIAKPTNLTATYSAESKAVVISWKASATTTIGGYNLYRSITTGKDYIKIADTGKTTVTYSDSKINANTTYYYMVRAYKDDFESASSDEASALVPADALVGANAKTTTSASTTADNNKFEMTTLLWILSGAGILLLGILLLLILRRKRQAKNHTGDTKMSS